MKRARLQAFPLFGIGFIALISFGLVISSHALIDLNKDRISGRAANAVGSMPPLPQSSNHSVLFNGTTAYVDAPNSSSLDIAGLITIEAWVKLNATTGGYRTVLQKANWYGSEGGYDLCITGEGKARADIYNSAATYQHVIGNTPLSAGVWHHIPVSLTVVNLRFTWMEHLTARPSLLSL